MDQPRRRIARYVVEEELGRGMMGVVWRATDPELGRSVALKTVQLAFAVSPEEADSFERRFLAEARAAARLSHPAIVVVHDVGRDPDTNMLYIAFEHLRGRTLAQLVASSGPLEWREALRIVARVADALHHAHAQGVVHRDIKPANVMLLDSGELKVMDFGIAKVPAERLTSTGQFFGTPSYMSPEQASAEVIDGRSDLFSLAAVLYLLLTGRTAFEGDSVPATLSRILFRDPAPPTTLVPGLPPALDAVLGRALAKKPGDRYPDARAFALDLEDIRAGRVPESLPSLPQAAEGTQVSQQPPPPVPASQGEPLRGDSSTSEAPRRTRLGRRAILGGGAALVLGAILLGALEMRFRSVTGLSPSVPVEINFEHPLRSGVLKVFVDDDLVLEEALESFVKEDLVVMKVRKGRLTKGIDVAAGDRVLRLEVDGEGFRGSRTIQGRFVAGEPRRLEARLGGLVKKDLSAWLAPARKGS
jgi:serine/threonine-protein kinase